MIKRMNDLFNMMNEDCFMFETSFFYESTKILLHFWKKTYLESSNLPLEPFLKTHWSKKDQPYYFLLVAIPKGVVCFTF